MKEKIKELHAWTLQWAETKWGVWVMFFCAFADASFLPLPTNMFFLMFALLNMKKVFSYAFYTTLGSLLGALAGYAIGYFAWQKGNGDFTALAQFLFHHIPGFTETVYNTIHIQFVKWDFWILIVASLIPVPYKIFAISSGVFDVNIFVFSIITLVAQGVKFYTLALLVLKIGPEVKKLLQFNFKPVAIIITTCVAIVFVIIKEL